MIEILKEMNQMSEGMNDNLVDAYINELSSLLLDKNSSDFNIIGLGAGRMGYSLRSFIMRLSHMGFNASMIGDTNVPRVKKNSIIFINSSSGETPSILLYAQQAAEEGGKIFLTSCSMNSSISQYANRIIQIPEINSKQLMKSPYEQFSMLLYDYIVIRLMDSLDLDPIQVSHNHSILE